jgi:glycogen debranching enzyme
VSQRLAGRTHVLAAFSRANEPTRVLKHQNTFAVLDLYGDIRPGGLGEQGLYDGGTRFLSCLLLEIEGCRPLLLSSTVRDDSQQLIVTLTNADLLANGQVWLPAGTLHLTLEKLLWRGACYQRVCIKNLSRNAVETELALHFEADFADIFEPRGSRRTQHGLDLVPEVSHGRVVLGHRGLDRAVRRTVLQFDPAPTYLTGATALVELALAARQEISFVVTAACEHASASAVALRFDQVCDAARADRKHATAPSCQVETSNPQMTAWLGRAAADLHMLSTELPTGPYPYAGIPWFNTPFGRDGIITALECLWLRPQIARGALAYLAHTQAHEDVPEQDAEPGKIVHEVLCGETAALRRLPSDRDYGSVDATPLFIVLAAAYFERTADRAFLESLWPNVDAALHWIDDYGDRDRDGFVEYSRRSAEGLIHQGWKDSDDAVSHADGSRAEGPIALCEVQGYVYAAYRAGAALAATLGQRERAAQLTSQAEALRRRFDAAFWCEELSTYALALDGNKRPCRVRTSNAGQCLFTGIAMPERAHHVARTVLGPDSFSGWGVRTLAACEHRYDPMSYHAGAVWPHDNALIAFGLARYGLVEQSRRIFRALFEAGQHFDLQRMPELFCGFPREPGEGPIPYPLACAPQAWSAGSVFLLLQACLRLEIDAARLQVRFTQPQLPDGVEELRIHNLEVGAKTVDLRLVRNRHHVDTHVLRQEQDHDLRIVIAD